MSYENLFIGDFSDEDKNKIFLKEPLESNSVRFEKDGFTIKLENGVELIHAENGIVIRVAQGKETPTKPTRKGKTFIVRTAINGFCGTMPFRMKGIITVEYVDKNWTGRTK